MSRSIWSITLVISVLTGQICFGAKSLSYVIQRGDTLSEIAQRYGVSQRQLIELNDLENNTIRQGQRLEIPSTSKVYIVRSGDTLSHLAIRFNTTVNKLSEINKLKNTRIKIGQKLRIPSGNTKIRRQNKKAEKYIVRKGDTVSQIAIQHKIRLQDLNNWNSISNNELIYPGQELRLTPPNTKQIVPKQSNHYLVKKGDTLYKISRDFDISLNLLIQINKLNDNPIKPGQKLLIRPTNLHEVVHVVRAGETLSEIAALYKLNLNVLRKLNDLRGDRILIGQKLRLRHASKDIHLVERGDALWEIARAYGISVSLLRELNNLNSDRIYPGQELKLISNTENYAMYVVQSGDYLGEIARLHQMSLSELRKLNKLKTSIIHPGEKLKVRPLRWLELSKIDWNSLRINHPKIFRSKNGPYYGKRPNADHQKNKKYYENHPYSPHSTFKIAKVLWEKFQKKINGLGKLSSTLKGWHVVLDPGHGGLDPGAIAKTIDGNNTTLFVTEDEYVYDIALRVYVLLQLHGADVTITLLSPNHLIRSNDPPTATFVNEKNEVYNSLSHNKSNTRRDWPRGGNLSTRVRIARRAFKETPKGKRVFLSFHADIDHNAPEAPLVLYYESRSGKRIDRSSKRFAEGLLNTLGAGARARGQGLGVLRDNPADVKVLLELRNMAYRDHVWALRFEQLRQRDAEKVVQGLLNYVKNTR
ncbi:MAG: LysM peptidoglycan-binding domain-containing protein [Candidatus Latescibacterota bacterium]|nr:LysM peptidoglycan-binding domain-containing protein [Candidatus Latescibacterota bacterium]